MPDMDNNNAINSECRVV